MSYADPQTAREYYRRYCHGADRTEWFASAWHEQDGRCYLCGDALSLDASAARSSMPFIDHDHTCCPRRYSCARCRRGLACSRCNVVIGHVQDSPELLRKIAGNLEPALIAARERIAAKGWP